MITRKIGALVRGKATPFQLFAACVLGALLGFAPALTQGPALVLLLIAALLFVNANLGLALLVAGGARLLSLATASLAFSLGRFLLEGPTEGLARTLVNTPILAWCGLEYYAVAGGQLIGLVVGLVLGWLVVGTMTRVRKRMAAAEGNPGRLKELTSKPGVGFLIWLLLGKSAKGTWEEKAAKRVGNPIRIWGAALIVLGLVGAYLAQQTLAGPLARRGLVAGLEGANGATVDVDTVELDLGEGRMAVAGLAMADPAALGEDLFRADRLELDVDQADFLRRRFHVAKVVVHEAHSGAPRATPGERLAPEPEPEPEPEASQEGDYGLKDVLADWELWRDRLVQARRWLDRLAPAKGEGGEAEADVETLEERLAREVREGGWFAARADQLIEGVPTFRLSELSVSGLGLADLPDRVFDLEARELSTNPALVDAPPTLELSSRDGAIGFLVDLAPASRHGGNGALRFHWKGFDLDAAMAKLRLPGAAPFQGGTIDLAIDGAWDQGRIGRVDLPLKVTLRNTRLTMKGIDPTDLDQLELSIGLKGSIDAPRIRFDASAITDALVAAGKKQLADRLRGELDARLGGKVDEALGDLKEKAGIELPTEIPAELPKTEELKEEAKDALKGLFPKKKKGS
jgi:uncharacterized protein (TIGR03546 family)